MASPRTRLPDVESERIINETLRRVRLMNLSVTSSSGGGGGTGPVGPPSPVGGSPWVPTLIDTSETFTVPENTQVLWSVPITILGILDIQGAFIMVN